jgi:hypothetical protein
LEIQLYIHVALIIFCDVQIQAFPNDDQTTLRSTFSKVIATKKGKIDSQEQAMEMELNSI